MLISINQPAYLAWLGYYDRIDAADLHVVLDHVQFEKNSFTNRNKLLTPQGEQWLSVPVRTKGKFGSLPLTALEIQTQQRWQKKHLRSLEQHYRKAPFFDRYFPELAQLYEKETYTHLLPLILEMDRLFFGWLNIQTPTVRSSTLDLSQTKSALVLEICQKLKATTYLSGALGKDYLQLEDFEQAGIEVKFQSYQHPSYDQLQRDFTPYLATLDMLFMQGDKSLDLIRSGRCFNSRL